MNAAYFTLSEHCSILTRHDSLTCVAVSGFMPVDRVDGLVKIEAAEPEFGGKNFVALIQVARVR